VQRARRSDTGTHHDQRAESFYLAKTDHCLESPSMNLKDADGSANQACLLIYGRARVDKA